VAQIQLISGHQSKKALKFICICYSMLSKALTRNLSKRLPSERYLAPGSKSVCFTPISVALPEYRLGRREIGGPLRSEHRPISQENP
jgi:hypothetical protein